MKVRKWAFCLGVTALFAGLYAYPASADFYCESESVSTNLSHRRSGPSIQKYYFTPDALRVELGNNKVGQLQGWLMARIFLREADEQAKTPARIIR